MGEATNKGNYCKRLFGYPESKSDAIVSSIGFGAAADGAYSATTKLADPQFPNFYLIVTGASIGLVVFALCLCALRHQLKAHEASMTTPPGSPSRSLANSTDRPAAAASQANEGGASSTDRERPGPLDYGAHEN